MTRTESGTFPPPLERCPVCGEYVRLDDSRELCAQRMQCGRPPGSCPLTAFFQIPNATAAATQSGEGGD